VALKIGCNVLIFKPAGTFNALRFKLLTKNCNTVGFAPDTAVQFILRLPAEYGYLEQFKIMPDYNCYGWAKVVESDA
jgi:hypothetical protein